MLIVVAGVSGTGKSTVGKALAGHYSLPFFDGDDFHSKANIEKMKRGKALNDEDRFPWLEALSNLLIEHEKAGGAVLACSALKEAYRNILSANKTLPVHWIVLTGSEALLASRLSSRNDHFFDPKLLRSQLNTFQLPYYGKHIDVAMPVEEVVHSAIKFINRNV
ncbi:MULTISPECIES: gluconokinase [Alteromonas]|uniref:Gluconokinase n=2 Tax=Alteromonas TaxID=226 RepID=A0A6T9Y4U1_ALTMA|nr:MULTISPECIES: gluconokinase, GntK/IdnK-type [Alteromonas]TKB03065.1 gluconokinase [Alteromonas portus]CAB9495257.1 Gluconokinase [Alteromonas macleodii]